MFNVHDNELELKRGLTWVKYQLVSLAGGISLTHDPPSSAHCLNQNSGHLFLKIPWNKFQ